MAAIKIILYVKRGVPGVKYISLKIENRSSQQIHVYRALEYILRF